MTHESPFVQARLDAELLDVEGALQAMFDRLDYLRGRNRMTVQRVAAALEITVGCDLERAYEEWAAG